MEEVFVFYTPVEFSIGACIGGRFYFLPLDSFALSRSYKSMAATYYKYGIIGMYRNSYAAERFTIII